jgi:hypothetical protein
MSDATPTIITEILNGDALPLAAAAKKLPPHRGKAVAPSTLWRWHKKGVEIPDDRRVHLELARVGCKWLTSAAALTRFIVATSTSAAATEAQPKTEQAGKARGTRDRKRSANQQDRVEKELDRAGL